VRLYTLAELDPIVPPCPGIAPVAIFTSPNHICPGTCTDFTNLSTGALTFEWSFPGATPSLSTDVSPTNICYQSPGTYSVQLIANGTTGSDTLLLNNFITVYPYPAPQGISQNGDTLFANAGAVSYQWYHAGVLIPGATNYFYVATEGGNFNVVATDANNCEVEAAIFDVVAALPAIGNASGPLQIYPNPVTDKLFFRPAASSGNAVVSVYNVIGEKVIDVRPEPGTSEISSVNVSSLAPAVYFLEFKEGLSIVRARFVKE
jgi:PKD repeat protein